MKQILQNLKTGVTTVSNIPVPKVKPRELLIKTSSTLVSAGTERMLIEFGKAGWISKARNQPDKVRMVLDKIKTDGIQPTVEAVFNKLNQPLPLGYCNVGHVVSCGKDVKGFKKGERVISNGKHAEVVSVPVNLCAKVPKKVSDEEAAFTVLGAVALQGIRLAKPTLGETIVVIGLGLVGLITVQLLRAHGCRVLGLDFDKEKLKLARKFGAEVVDLNGAKDPVKTAKIYSRERGVDAVIITASTKSNKPMHQAALMCRKRARIILVGITGLELSREDFFEKELTFQVSASYGPGRYDPNYEEKGQDYPVGFVRWTEQRNFEAILDMMEEGYLDVKTLISHRFSIDDAMKAYELVISDKSSLGILLNFPGINITSRAHTISLDKNILTKKSSINNNVEKIQKTRVSVSFIGSGNHATSSLIPAFKKSGAHLRSIASSAGVSSFYASHKFCFEENTTDTNKILSDIMTNAVVITTQHDSHAKFVVQALKAGKHIFVEKPLCLTQKDLQDIKTEYFLQLNEKKVPPLLMVGFNRRFAPQIQKIKQLLDEVSSPKSFIMTINSGYIPKEHWTQDPQIGGGRIIGESCHFIDLLRFLAGNPIQTWNRFEMETQTNDTITLTLNFTDGSIGTIHYFSNGHKSFPKERLEIFVQGRVLQLDNYRKLRAFGWAKFNTMNLWQQDKGQKACANAFLNAIKHKQTSPIAFEEIIEISQLSIDIAS